MPIFIEEVLSSLPREVRAELFSAAGITGALGRAIELTPTQGRAILPLLLQRVTVDDGTFARLASEANINLITSKKLSHVVVSVPFISKSRVAEIPITELAASSVVVWEICLRVKEVQEGIGIGEDFDPPDVRVERGSINFSLGGGPSLIGGIGLVVAAHAALPLGAAATIAYWGGSLVTALGLIETIFSWRKTYVEIEKTTAEKEKFEMETRAKSFEVLKLTAETRKLEAEALLNAASEALKRVELERVGRQLVPASSFLPQETIVAEAELYGLDPALATHLVNRVLPIVADATKSYPSTITSSSHGSGRAAGAA